MKPSAAILRDVRTLLGKVADEGGPHSPAAARCAAQLATLRRKPVRLKRMAFPPPDRQKAKERKRLAHKLSTDEIRAVVWQRSRGLCELCEQRLFEEGELHHLESGRLRRKLQAFHNCMRVHRHCHTGPGSYHDKPEKFRARVIAWAKNYGYPVPSKFRRPPR